MLQQIATAKPGQPAPDPSTALEGLGRGWLILRNCRLGRPQGGGLPSALIHPAVGVALLDILPSELPGAVEAFRARLAAARFQAIFPGDLPVVHLRLSPRQLDELPGRLESAFADQPPLSLPGGDAWITAVARALTTEPTVPRLRSRRIRRRHRRRFFALWRLAGSAALAAGMLAAAYVVTGTHQPHAPAAEALSAESPPASVAVEVPIPAAQNVAALPLAPPPETAAARDPVVQEQAPSPAAPEPSASQAPVPPETQEKQEAAAPRTPRPSPPERLTTGDASHAGSAAAESRATVPAPRPTPAARRPDSEFPQPEKKENPSGKSAALPPMRLHEAPQLARLPPIAARVPPPIADPVAAHPPPEPPLQRCRRIVYLVGQGLLLPDEDLRFFQQTCVRR